MKLKIWFYVIALLCGLVFVAHSMKNYCKYYQGIRVTPDNLPIILAKDEFKVPKAVSKWVQKNKEALKRLAGLVCFDEEDLLCLQRSQAVGNYILQKNGLKNLSTFNFVFFVIIEKKPYLIKISGAQRLCSLVVDEFGLEGYGELKKHITKSNIIKWLSGGAKTYQTASRSAGFVAYTNWKQRNSDSSIIVPSTYLVPFEDGDLIDDEHCVIVQEYVVGNSLESNPELFVNHYQECKDFVGKTGRWNCGSLNWLINDYDEIVYCDLEEPHNMKSTESFFQNSDRLKKNINCGLSELKELHERLKILLSQ